jgi:hypothetical protein
LSRIGQCDQGFKRFEITARKPKICGNELLTYRWLARECLLCTNIGMLCNDSRTGPRKWVGWGNVGWEILFHSVPIDRPNGSRFSYALNRSSTDAKVRFD